MRRQIVIGWVKTRAAIVPAVIVAMATAGCAAGDLLAPQPQTAEQFCGTLPTIGTGKWFFCPSNQSNLRTAQNFGGFCQVAQRNNLGLVGYSATTFNGGADTVKPFSEAQQMCNLLNSGNSRQCGAIARCTREQ